MSELSTDVACHHVVVRLAPHEGNQFGGDLPHLCARKDLTDDFKRKMLYDNPVRFYRFSEGDIAAARKAKGS